MAYPVVILQPEEGEEETTEGTAAHAEEPKEVANPILPTGNELVFAGGFFVLLWALMKFVLLPPVLKVMEQRDEQVRGDKAAADDAAAQREALVAEYEASLASARAEATRILEDARARADANRAQVVGAAEAEVAAARAAAAAEVAEAKAAAMAELRGQVAGIATTAAEAVVQRPVDRAGAQQLVEQYLSRTGSQN